MNRHHHYTYLALGDSYTIGESVPLHESFPYQTVQLLRKNGLLFHAPEIVAQTGWTSFELAEHLLHTKLNDTYDFVTLLIGVNNQYRGLSLADFSNDISFLLRKALHFTGGDASRVIMLSIPDWGVTPFAKDRDTHLISKEINAFNQVCETAANEMHIPFINITPATRNAADDRNLLAADLLHYSGKAHLEWAEQVADTIRQLAHK